MRKITSKEKERKKQKRNQLIIGAILVILMFTSVFGIIVNSFNSKDNNSEKIEYNGYTFIQSGGLWEVKYNDQKLAFSYLPEQTPSTISIDSELKSLQNYYSQPLYIYSEDYYSTSEIYNALNPFVSRVQFACESIESCDSEDYPIKDCSDNFILVKEADDLKITQNEKCVYIEGPIEDLRGITDEFLFRVLGIKE